MRSGAVKENLKRHCRGAVWCTLLLFWVALFACPGMAREWVKVDKAVDGDTFRLVDGSWVRCLGIDAPEIDHVAHTEQSFGYAARDALARMVNGAKVVLEPTPPRYDVYGRRLALVRNEKGVLVNQAMLELGLAHVLAFPPYNDHDALFLTVQRDAMRKGVGLWRQPVLKSEGKYTGNQRSRRFHRDDCRQVPKIHQKNRVVLATRWEAFWLGFAPCRHCFPVK